jgi:uncharacterized repeat protein (TIGR04076 family)
MYRVLVEVEKVKGECAAGHKVGDTLVLDAFEGATEPLTVRTNKMCVYFLSDLIPYLTALYRDTSKGDWINGVERLCCSDEGKVVVRIRRERIE